jgi:diketogulonate reductase-like aldo/keto reductase
VVQHGMSVVTSASDRAYQKEDLGVNDFELSAQDMADLDAV